MRFDEDYVLRGGGASLHLPRPPSSFGGARGKPSPRNPSRHLETPPDDPGKSLSTPRDGFRS